MLASLQGSEFFMAECKPGDEGCRFLKRNIVFVIRRGQVPNHIKLSVAVL